MHRTTPHLTLTERGTVFFDQCKKILDELDQAEKMIGEGLNKATGHLIVSAPAAFGRKHVAPHAPAFLAANPDVKISFNLSDQVVDLVREGYDLSIRIGGTIDPSLIAVNLYSNHRVVCAAPDYLEKHGVPKNLKDLSQHNCLTFNLQGGQQRGWHFNENNKTVIIRTAGNLDCNDGRIWAGLAFDMGNTIRTRFRQTGHRTGRLRPSQLRHHGSLPPAKIPPLENPPVH